MTRLYNDPSSFALEAVAGMAAAYPRYLTAVHGGAVRSTASPAGQVSVVIGGGSGHYPAFAAWVGPGTAACGAISSPPHPHPRSIRWQRPPTTAAASCWPTATMPATCFISGRPPNGCAPKATTCAPWRYRMMWLPGRWKTCVTVVGFAVTWWCSRSPGPPRNAAMIWPRWNRSPGGPTIGPVRWVWPSTAVHCPAPPNPCSMCLPVRCRWAWASTANPGYMRCRWARPVR